MEKESESEEKGDTRPRRPRRQRSMADPPEPQLQSEEKSSKEIAEPQAKPRRRRREIEEEETQQGDGGWMGGSDRKGKKFEPEPEPEKDVMAVQNKDKHFNDDDGNDIMIIPDLDEDGGGESDARVAHAPRNVSRKVPNLSTLQSEAKNSLQTNKDGIDLSILLGTLVPPNMLMEDDALWTFDSLLREVTEELNGTKAVTTVKKQ